MSTAYFKGLKVIELASVLAGPAVGMFFAELGAKVIKVENKRTAGDVTRNWKLATEDPDSNSSAYYNSINWGKESIFLDLTSTEGRDHLLALLKDADILITNFKKGSAKKLNLHYEFVRTINSSIIYANLTAFGEDRDDSGYDVLLQAETGFLFMTGDRNGNPAKMPVALIDVLAAHQLKEAILIALLERQQKGEGSFITVSLAHSAIASLANQASNFLNEQAIPQRMGTQHPNISPYGDILNTSDGKEIILAIGTEEQFRVLCEQLGLAGLATDNRFHTNRDRVENRSELIPIIQDAAIQYKQAELIDMLKKQLIPVGRIRNMKEVFELPEAMEMILENKDGSRCVSTIAFDIQDH